MRYTLYFGFVRKHERDYEYYLKYGFVFRRPKTEQVSSSGYIGGWTSYRHHYDTQINQTYIRYKGFSEQAIKMRVGGIIDVDDINSFKFLKENA